jgi:hypothetical protein
MPLWNWKSAILSVTLRTPLFFAAAISAGLGAAAAAAGTDVAFRAIMAGFCGAITQRLRHTRPPWIGTLAVMVLVPLLSHGVEALVHWRAGTPHFTVALAASMSLTVVTTTFDLYAMRRGVLIAGAGGASLTDDLIRLPGLVVGFGRAIILHLAAR